MPIYVYVCSSCDRAQEHIHGVDKPAPPCEECGGNALERQITSASFRFERSVGWDGWDRVGPGTIGRMVDNSKHINDPVDTKNPGSRKGV